METEELIEIHVNKETIRDAIKSLRDNVRYDSENSEICITVSEPRSLYKLNNNDIIEKYFKRLFVVIADLAANGEVKYYDHEEMKKFKGSKIAN